MDLCRDTNRSSISSMTNHLSPINYQLSNQSPVLLNSRQLDAQSNMIDTRFLNNLNAQSAVDLY